MKSIISFSFSGARLNQWEGLIRCKQVTSVLNQGSCTYYAVASGSWLEQDTNKGPPWNSPTNAIKCNQFFFKHCSDGTVGWQLFPWFVGFHGLSCIEIPGSSLFQSPERSMCLHFFRDVWNARILKTCWRTRKCRGLWRCNKMGISSKLVTNWERYLLYIIWNYEYLYVYVRVSIWNFQPLWDRESRRKICERGVLGNSHLARQSIYIHIYCWISCFCSFLFLLGTWFMWIFCGSRSKLKILVRIQRYQSLMSCGRQEAAHGVKPLRKILVNDMQQNLQTNRANRQAVFFLDVPQTTC